MKAKIRSNPLYLKLESVFFFLSMRDKECDQMIVYRVSGKERQNENPYLSIAEMRQGL